MNASILSTLLLVSPASLPSTQLPSVVEPESGAWAVVHAGQLWVCWSPGPDCFERVVFDGEDVEPDDELDDEPADELLLDLDAPEQVEVGSAAWQIGFGGPRSLWVEHGEQRWRIVRGQRRARQVEDPAPVRLGRIGPAGCGPAGIVPAVIGGRLSWREAPRCVVEVAASTCVAQPWPRPRAPTPIRARAGIEIATTRAWTAEDNLALGLGVADRRRKSGFELAVVIEIGFDWRRRTADQRARAMVAGRGRARVRELPKVTPGPLAAAELEALANVVCGGTP